MNIRKALSVATAGLLLITQGCAGQSQFNALDRTLGQITLHHTAMDFADYFKELRGSDTSSQEKLLHTLSLQLEAVSQEGLSFCQRVAMDDARSTLNLARARLQLLQQLDATSPDYQGSFSRLDNGASWYAHWLRSWLQSDVTLEELRSVAMRELNDARRRRESLRQSGLKANLDELNGQDTHAIVKAFEQRERTVYRYSEKVLGTPYRASGVNIARSTLPKSFPAPGIYDEYNQAFIYHLHGETFPVKQMDWLFLHEAVPGHHYFSQYAQQSARCPNFQGLQGSTLFTEGWAAYVENLGQDLGLFGDSSSAGYALDWQELRAVRVLLDIGIHARGWSDDKAREVWLAHIPEQRDIMQREIDRIRRWPVQVITYVYGKARIKQAIDELQSRSPGTTLAEAHQQVLSLSNFSLRSLKHLKDI